MADEQPQDGGQEPPEQPKPKGPAKPKEGPITEAYKTEQPPADIETRKGRKAAAGRKSEDPFKDRKERKAAAGRKSEDPFKDRKERKASAEE